MVSGFRGLLRSVGKGNIKIRDMLKQRKNVFLIDPRDQL